VGRLGPSAVAAVALSGTILGIIWIVIMGISIGTVAMVARFIGAKEFEKADNVAAQSLLMSLIGGTVTAIVGFFSAEFVLKAMGAKGEVLILGVSYFRILCLGALAIFPSVTLAFALRGAGDAITTTKILIFSTGLNIVLDPLLIFGPGWFPRLGVAGSAIATVIARSVEMVILLFIFFKGKSHLHINLKRAKIEPAVMGQILKIGIFVSISELMWNISSLILMRIVAFYGTFAIAAYGIGLRLMIAIQMPGFGLAQSAATLVGQNLGANEPKRAEKSAWLTLGFYEVMMIVLTVIIFFFTPSIVASFNNNPEVVKIGATYLRFMAVTFVFMASSITLAGAMQGAGDSFSPMVIDGITLFLIRIPLTVFLANHLELATTGIWIGVAVSNVIGGLCMCLRFYQGKWKGKVILPSP
jgi:putative MATE family efflux protein